MTKMRKILDGVLSILHQLGWASGDFSSLKTITLRAGASKREFGLTYASVQGRHYLALAIPDGFHPPIFEELYTRYLDFNFDIYLLLKHLDDGNSGVDYLLYFDEQRSYLYDIRSQECLIYCAGIRERMENLFPHLEKKKVETGGLERLQRKSNDSLSMELYGWMDIWSVQLGSKTGARRETLNKFMIKLALARYYAILFGAEVPLLRFSGFVRDPSLKRSARRKISGSEYFRKLFDFFKSHLSLDLFTSSKAEISFLKKLEAYPEALNLFLIEFNFLCGLKFSLDVFLTLWCPEKERLISSRKAYTTERDEIKKRLFVSDGVVLKPVVVNLDEEGTPWALHLFDDVAQFWMNHNYQMKNRQMKMTESGKQRKILKSKRNLHEKRIAPGRQKFQMDMFGYMPDELDNQGCISNIIDHSLKTSFRVTGEKIFDDSSPFLFLLTAKCFEIWKKYGLPQEPLASLPEVFQKSIT